MGIRKCPYCSSDDLVYNAGRGDTVCGKCGELLEEQAMVSEMTFMQTSSGAAAAGGRSVVWGAGGGCFPGAGMQSNEELTISRGVARVGWIADRMQLSAQIQEAGRRMYQLAVRMNFNPGRPTRFIACACLYVVCRRNRSPHLLIDFSDVLQTPVKTLGRVYMKLVKRLVGGDPTCTVPMAESGVVQVPIIDPSIFIERFARKLDIAGHSQRKVQNTAMRLIQFMHRDWIVTGRRPNGLCGAALLVAAAYHGFSCSAKDISDVVRMGEGTLRMRLQEMQQTPLALMSKQDFEKAEIEDVHEEQRALPPCMRNRIRREERAALLDAEHSSRLALQDAMPPPSGTPVRRSSVLEDGSGRRKLRKLQESLESPPHPLPLASPSASSTGEAADAALVPLDMDRQRAEKYTAREPSFNDIEDIVKDITSHHGIEGILAGRVDVTQIAASQAVNPVVRMGAKGDQATSSSDGGMVAQTREAAAAKIKDLLAGRPAFDGPVLLEGSPSAAGTPRPAESEAGAGSGSETLSDVDDEELDMYLLDTEEQAHKSDIWHEVNKDYLEEWHVRGQESKRKRAAASAAGSVHGGGTSEAGDTASEAGSASRSRRWRPSARSCTQSAMMALAKKGKVGQNRINIEALESLFS